jgi:hypothetical protein
MAAGKDSLVMLVITTAGDPLPTIDVTDKIEAVNTFDNSIDVTQLDISEFGDDWSRTEEGLKDFTANITIRSIPNKTLIADETKGLGGLLAYLESNTNKDMWIKFKLTDFFDITAKMIYQTFGNSSDVDGQSGLTISLKNGNVAPTISRS